MESKGTTEIKKTGRTWYVIRHKGTANEVWTGFRTKAAAVRAAK